MTTTTPAAPTADAKAEPEEEATATIAPPKLRRRPALIAAGVLVVALGALIAVWAYNSTSSTVAVVAVRETIVRGQTIEASDLVAVQITTDPALSPVSGDRLEELVGQQAAMDMSAGSLVTNDQVTSAALPPAGESIVGVILTGGSTPAGQVQVGDNVRIVPTAGQGGDPEADQVTNTPISASVVLVTTDTQSGSTVVNVLVEHDQAPTVAGWSAAGRAALVVDPAGE